ncbi:MAG: hypothetical protein QNJ72_16930 [Pleurocapsa sp. MO_226.B13]|nr:hypothetical protein [Pleurocapsa sp. MO_226.B13]
MQNINSQLATAQKVQFLRQPASYYDRLVDGTERVKAIETHMSWVFLTERYAYKLKKPVRYEFLDFSTLSARYQDCQAELQLNRRLAPQVYLDVVPLVVNPSGQLQLGGEGKIVDWLVEMLRLSADAMLDVAIKEGTVEEKDLIRVVQHLVHFYRTLPPVNLSTADYLLTIESALQTTLQELTLHANGLPGDLVDYLIAELLAFLSTESDLFDRRIRRGKIIEGHGDLRPEHICLKPEIAIIDCLEFDRSLRILDCADELAFLALECDRLGAAWVGNQLLTLYRHATQDSPPERLIRFYKAYRACLRAKLAIWHMKEPGQLEAWDWFERATTYLHLAEKFLP